MQEGSREFGGSPDPTGFDSEDDGDDVPTDGPIVLSSHQVNEKALELERQQAGQLYFTDKVQALMKDMFNEVYAALQPKPDDRDKRIRVIKFIENFVKHKIPGSSISAFGSFVMDLYTASSDLDLSLNLSDGKRQCSRNDKVHYLRKVANALYGLQKGEFLLPVYQPFPTSESVMCLDGKNCRFNVSIQLLKLAKFLGLQIYVPLALTQVKGEVMGEETQRQQFEEWNIEFVVYMFACSVPPTRLFLPDVESCLNVVATRVWLFKDSGFGANNLESVPELFGSFFVKLVAVENLWGHGLCSSTYEGKWISKIWPKNHIGCISVEDFADRTQNVARSVSRKEFELIYQCFHATLSNLKDPVNNVMDSTDLRVYLFGAKQRHRALDHARLAATHVDFSQSGNGWSTNESRSSVSSNRGHQPHMDTSIQFNHSRVHSAPSHTTTGASGYRDNAQDGPGFQHHMSRSWNPGRVVNLSHGHAVNPDPQRAVQFTHEDLEYTVTHVDLVNPDPQRAVQFTHEDLEYTVTHVDLVKRSHVRDIGQPTLDSETASAASRNRHVYRNSRVLGSRVARSRDSSCDGSVVHVEPTQVARNGDLSATNRPGTYQPNTSARGTTPSGHRRYGRGNRSRGACTSVVGGDVQPHNLSNHQRHGDSTVDGRWQT
ncbi:hypothetical protein AXG93_115s1420 [Marchantia polymorpha subsp. ruderalis]|uniref:Poly(A) RNA polymerase mitochondrial-like central palm domain-containing protein n=1 Tax=Marchantia polymorpha subsp. ruderalis TaxID=1480154 RepID=A0A176W7K3_MARPO|nr:hypothetical protein AXG93_115s1420 [Marchantia polymorpha subsp. ruderalis]